MVYSIDVTIDYYRTLYDKQCRDIKRSSIIFDKSQYSTKYCLKYLKYFRMNYSRRFRSNGRNKKKLFLIQSFDIVLYFMF